MNPPCSDVLLVIVSIGRSETAEVSRGAETEVFRESERVSMAILRCAAPLLAGGDAGVCRSGTGL